MALDQKHQVVLDYLVGYIKSSLPEGVTLDVGDGNVVTIHHPGGERHAQIHALSWTDQGDGFKVVLFNDHAEYDTELRIPLDMEMPDVMITIGTVYKYLDNPHDLF